MTKHNKKEPFNYVWLLVYVAVDCIALNYLGKHKRKMAIRGIN